MGIRRRDLLKVGSGGLAGAAIGAISLRPAHALADSGSSGAPSGRDFDVRLFGAIGDGKTIDTPSINKAIDAAAAAGGGVVRFPAGQYLCYSIRLKSNVCLSLEHGAVIIAADSLPPGVSGGYDEPESNQPWEAFQDFGHNHWHNSLIWGVGLHDVSIVGPGRIWGRGLSRENGPEARNPADKRTQGIGNKSISLKNCHNVLLKDFQILEGGWFGILATGVDNLNIDGLTIDTNRDGMDIDCCRNVHISNCSVNSPRDDGIVLKSSYALGQNRACENVTISSCLVSGAYVVGSVLDGTWKNRDKGGIGRIKFGTESNGGFKNIVITNCILDGCKGLTLESEDGGALEDIVIDNIVMRNLVEPPIFIRLNARLSGPGVIKPGAIRRVTISNLISSNAASRQACIISGLPDFPVEDLKISNLYLEHKGGEPREPAHLISPENLSVKPGDAGMSGATPSQGFFMRHVRNIEMNNVQIVATAPDQRPSFVLRHVDGANFFRVRTNEPSDASKFVLNDVSNFQAARCCGIEDTEVPHTTHEEI